MMKDLKRFYYKMIIFHFIFYTLFTWFLSEGVKPEATNYVIVMCSIVGIFSMIFTSIIPLYRLRKNK